MSFCICSKIFYLKKKKNHFATSRLSKRCLQQLLPYNFLNLQEDGRFSKFLLIARNENEECTSIIPSFPIGMGFYGAEDLDQETV